MSLSVGRLLAVVCAGVTLINLGCARVTVRKVPTPTQYVRWTDAMQRKADRIEGFRFYLPRPFINVFESFPVRTDVYIADGVVSPDGKYVIIKRVRADSDLATYMAAELGSSATVPTREVLVPAGKGGGGGSAQSKEGTLDDAATTQPSGDDEVPTGTDEEPAKPDETEGAGGTDQRTGISSRAVTNDNGAFAYQPMRGNFDVAYLPDFEEQYAVSSEANLGNAEFALNLGQGWSLQGFNSLTDNSQLNDRIFDVIDSSIKMAKSLATQGTSNLIEAMKARAAARAQSRVGTLEERAVPGTDVSLKIVVVHYAARGLYPVLKPRELQERQSDRSASFMTLDLFRARPQWGSTASDKALADAQRAIRNETGTFTVPRYPYQYISFNTFRYMAIEVVQPSTDGASPFRHLYDKTGTSGDRGDVRNLDVPTGSNITVNPTPTTGTTSKIPPMDALESGLRSKELPVGGGKLAVATGGIKRLNDTTVKITFAVLDPIKSQVSEPDFTTEFEKFVNSALAGVTGRDAFAKSLTIQVAPLGDPKLPKNPPVWKAGKTTFPADPVADDPQDQ
jgi:hypothetical protein